MENENLKVCEQCNSKTEILFYLGDLKVCMYCYDEAKRTEEKF